MPEHADCRAPDRPQAVKFRRIWGALRTDQIAPRAVCAEIQRFPHAQEWGSIRGQRFKRRHGQPNVFDVDPVMVGSVPRYRRTDVLAWLEKRG